jgi:predicted helicase
MPVPGTIKPKHKAIVEYHQALRAYSDRHVTHEGALETAFQRLLSETARPHGWFLTPKRSLRVKGKHIIPDGTLLDLFNLPRGYWEAKDTDDDLGEEIAKKRAKGYPFGNTIFEDTRRGLLFQNGQLALDADLANPQAVADLLNGFYAYAEPDIEGFEQAVAEFQERVPELALALADKIKLAHQDNRKFQEAFANFFTLCQSALNPNISQSAVDEMLVQHLLTERLIRKIFDNPEFTRRNVIAAEVEKVIAALVSKTFNRDEFLKSLDKFYKAIESAARVLEDFSEKQHFLNTVYERFFQGYSVKVADTHGIVYTPQAIVDFMCASVAEVLQSEFGKTLGDKDVQILDPCTGTGNFIVNLLRRIPKKHLPRVYREQLFANEVMLLPYYIAALNIEHAYYELTGDYEAFEGLCFVDTLDMAEGAQQQMSFMTAENAARVEREKKAPITVIIGNPPYNVGQLNENDNNKNRKYEVIDRRIRETYVKSSRATNVNKLSDPYVKFFRWAIDRLEGRDGIVCLVSNNSFIEQIAFDGMRKQLMDDLTDLYHVHLEGNVRENPTLSGTAYNVFGIQVGVGITIGIRIKGRPEHKLYFQRVDKSLRRAEKLDWLAQRGTITGTTWQSLMPDERYTWLVPDNADEFSRFAPLGSKASKTGNPNDTDTIFRLYSIGVVTNRDNVVYDFDVDSLRSRVTVFIDNYNGEVFRYQRAGANADVDGFVRYDAIKWSRDLKKDLKRGKYAEFAESKIRHALYRPFCKKQLFFDPILNQDITRWPTFLPMPSSEYENKIVIVGGYGRKQFAVSFTQTIADLNFYADPAQCFPFYVYDEDGTNRCENVTDWALNKFREHYKSKKISKWDIFYYVYGLLHHAGYREKFADNLKRELPRIPLARDFPAFSAAGQELARLHLDYEQLEPWPLVWRETPDVPLSYHVEKMKLAKDKKSLVVNPSLTLAGIPPETFDYRLGNRSALEWVIDQYQISEDKRSGIRSDPNRPDDPEYIVRLVGQVVRVSVDTVRIVEGLPAFA